MKIICGPQFDKKEIEIEIPNDFDTLGVQLSGGPDSAILLYLLAKENQNRKNILIFTVPKHDGAALYVQDIVVYVREHLKLNLPNPIFVGNPDLHHGLIVRNANTEIFEKYKSICLFTGTNQNPPSQFKMPGLYPYREPYNANRKIKTPFLHLYKYHILDLYYQFGQEKLLELTHTCTEQQIGRCNKCFQCSERAWGFDQLGKIDPGIK